MDPSSSPPIPITIITGFLGSGKTTLILNLIPQLPSAYRLALIKNEFGDVAVDSQLAGAAAISGVTEMLNGCICCNLVGSLQDALEALRTENNPDRVIIETSGSAFPATLAMEVNRIARLTGNYSLDGVISVIDVENWKGYEDTSVTAKLQAHYTDLLVLNKWELVSERIFDDCIDRILDLDLDIPTARAKSLKGWIDRDLILGLDAKLARTTAHGERDHAHSHEHDHDHHGEVEVLSITLNTTAKPEGIDLDKLEDLLTSAPKDEVYRIKGLLYSLKAPASSTGEHAPEPPHKDAAAKYILNWAFGRWTFTLAPSSPPDSDESEQIDEPLLRMTIVTAKYEGDKWKKRAESGDFLTAQQEPEKADLQIVRVS